MSGSTRYTVFKRSARNFTEFGTARKITIERNLTWSEARRMCDEFNQNRSPRQVRAGTKLEFTS